MFVAADCSGFLQLLLWLLLRLLQRLLLLAVATAGIVGSSDARSSMHLEVRCCSILRSLHWISDHQKVSGL